MPLTYRVLKDLISFFHLIVCFPITLASIYKIESSKYREEKNEKKQSEQRES